MKKQIFTLLTLLVCVGTTTAWATDYTLGFPNKTTNTCNGSFTSGTATFTVSGKTFTVTNTKSKSQTTSNFTPSGGSKCYGVKWAKSVDYTVNIPSGLKVTAVKFGGWANSSDNAAQVSKINGTDVTGETGNSFSKKVSYDEWTYNFASAQTGSFTFTTDGTEVIWNITLTATSTPTLTGAWSKSSDTFYQGDAAPTVPTFTVGASDSSTPASSAYNVAYSLKAGSTEGIVTFDENDGISAISNSTVGTATIVATLTTANAENYLTPATNTFEYTVTVNAKTPAITLDKESVTLKSTPVTRNATTTVNLTGVFLTGASGTVTWTAVDGLTISPTSFDITEGAASEEFTVTYNKDAATSGSVNVTFSDGTTNKVLTVNYSSVVPHTETTSVSEATTWDWSEITVSGNEYQLTGLTTPTKDYTSSNDIVATDFDGEIYPFNVGFSSKFGALKFGSFEYPARKNGSNKFFQGTAIKFTTTVPGTLAVTFANTGSKDSNGDRCISVDGTNYTDVTSGKSDEGAQRTKTVTLPAGNHTLQGYQLDKEDAAYLRISKIVFTPCVTATISAYGKSTFSSTYAVDCANLPTGLKAYKATAATTTSVHMEEVNTAVAGMTGSNHTGLVLVGTPNTTYYIPVAASGTEPSGNLLFGWNSEWGNLKASTTSGTNFVLSVQSGNVVWAPVLSTEAPITNGQAALWADVTIDEARALTMVFDDESTGISATLNDKGQMINDKFIYDLQGRKVANPQKGLYIVNGKKVIIK